MGKRLLGLCVALASMSVSVNGVQAAESSQPAGTHLERMLLKMVNADRKAAGLPALHNNPRLDRVALAHSTEMGQHGFFSHSSISGMSPFQRMARYGIRYHTAGENLGWEAGASPMQALQSINSAMLQSPTHRANLLNAAYRHIGVGIALFGDRLYVTEDFTG